MFDALIATLSDGDHNISTESQGSQAFNKYFAELDKINRLHTRGTESGHRIAGLSLVHVPVNKTPHANPRSILILRNKQLRGEEEFSQPLKQQLNKSIILWLNNGINRPLLNTCLKQTIKLQDVYLRSINEAKQKLLTCPGRPKFLSSLWKDVLLNDYVESDKILPNRYATKPNKKQVQYLGDFEIHSSSIKTTKSVSTHIEWTIAWGSYFAAIEVTYPHHAHELCLYTNHINSLFAAIWQPAIIINYDKSIPVWVSQQNDLLLCDFSEFDDLYMMHISSMGIGSLGLTSQTQASQSWPVEICWQYNSGMCVGPVCRY